MASGDRTKEEVLEEKPGLIVDGGDEKSDMVYVKDAAHGIVLACFAQNLKHRDFNTANGQSYTLEDMANTIRKIYPEAVIDVGPGLDPSGLASFNCVFDISRAGDELGYSPQFTLEEGVRDCVETMKRLNIAG